jgi:hypothetical protein
MVGLTRFFGLMNLCEKSGVLINVYEGFPPFEKDVKNHSVKKLFVLQAGPPCETQKERGVTRITRIIANLSRRTVMRCAPLVSTTTFGLRPPPERRMKLKWIFQPLSFDKEPPFTI